MGWELRSMGHVHDAHAVAGLDRAASDSPAAPTPGFGPGAIRAGLGTGAGHGIVAGHGVGGGHGGIGVGHGGIGAGHGIVASEFLNGHRLRGCHGLPKCHGPRRCLGLHTCNGPADATGCAHAMASVGATACAGAMACANAITSADATASADAMACAGATTSDDATAMTSTDAAALAGHMPYADAMAGADAEPDQDWLELTRYKHIWGPNWNGFTTVSGGICSRSARNRFDVKIGSARVPAPQASSAAPANMCGVGLVRPFHVFINSRIMFLAP